MNKAELDKTIEEELLQKGIQQLMTEASAFQFLSEDEAIYSTKDLKEKYK